MKNMQLRIVEHSNTCSDSNPARHLRENPLHFPSWRILCTAQYFTSEERGPNDSTMATQLEKTTSLLHSETAPFGNNLTIINYTSSGRLFYSEDEIILCRKLLVFYFLAISDLFKHFSFVNICQRVFCILRQVIPRVSLTIESLLIV